MCQSQSPSLSLPLLPFDNYKLIFYICNYFSCVDKFICSLFFLDSTYDWYHTIFVFFCLTYFTQCENL